MNREEKLRIIEQGLRIAARAHLLWLEASAKKPDFKKGAAKVLRKLEKADA
jgi:hypothetical protein